MEVRGQLRVLAALPPGKGPWYPLNSSLDVFQYWSGHYKQEINLLPLQGFDPGSSNPQPSHYMPTYCGTVQIHSSAWACSTDIRVSEGTLGRILNLITRWKRVASFTLRPLYPLATQSCYPLDRRLGVPDHVQTVWTRDKSLVPARNQSTIPRSYSPYASHYSVSNKLVPVICVYSSSLSMYFI